MKINVVLAAAIGLALGGCAAPGAAPGQKQAGAFTPLAVDRSGGGLSAALQHANLSSASRQVAAEGIRALDAHEFKKASDLFNLALKTDLNNSYLHFFNALTYHYRALEGEGALFALAEQGYEMAVQFDSSNYTALHYRGLLHLDRREYAQAQHYLMEAALYDKRDPDLLYDLALASYQVKDPKTAYAALQALQSVAGEKEAYSPRVLRAKAIVAASAADAPGAEQALAELRLHNGSSAQTAFVAKRIDDWKASYAMPMVQAQYPAPAQPYGSLPQGANTGVQQQQQASPFGSLPAGANTGAAAAPYGALPAGANMGQQAGNPYGQLPAGMQGQFGGQPGARLPGAFIEKQMALVDVVIISTEEDNGNTMGVNLLDGLKLQFGNSSGTPAWAKTTSRVFDALTGANTTDSQSITRLIGVPGVTYSLNIANATEINSEVLARPTLVALGGQTSQFFSGVDVVGAAVSNGQGSSVQVQKEVGVKLTVTPEFLPEGLIKLQVQAERTFLTNPNSNVVFDFRLDTTKTIVNANVVMRFGETIILSGLSERDKSANNSGVPGLREVPLVQYLTSRNTQRDYHKNVMILLTPRRPQYTYRDQAQIEEERKGYSNFDRVEAEFQDKYTMWYRPLPSMAHVAFALSESALFREFRSGDLETPSWTSRTTHGGRLRDALSFLFY
ncbi:type II and III secretion system protein [Duganella sp. HH105]|uniref:type II and III secretion system protein n=1 Tax=Duganella sp. HH105 TaxID=1781067 RepID=UPI000877B076|nr:type II and III secretion system protein [Duganella sp. HH105]OEZ60646.1 type II secretion system protein D precursor [Duganella sp. HH105]